MNRIVFALLGFVLLVAAPALAQSDFGLSAADVLLLAAANSAPLDSFGFEYDLRYEVNLDSLTAAAVLSGSGAVDRAAHAFGASVTGDLKFGTTQFTSLDWETRWVGDTLYMNAGEGWQALESAPTAIADRIDEFTGLTVDPATLAVWNLAGIDGLNVLLTAIAAADPSTFITAERLDDEGQSAHFRLTADLHALFATDAFADGIVALGNAQGSNLIIYSRDDVAEMVRANNEGIDPATLSIDEFIGLDDHQINGLAVNLDMSIAPEKADYVDAPFNVWLSFSTILSDQNQPQTIAVPDDVTMVDALTMSLTAPQPPADGTTQIMYAGTLDEGAADSYLVDLQAGDTVTITARRLSLEFDPLITLFSPGGEALAENDDHDAPIFAAADYDAQIAGFAIAESGQYPIEVTDSYGGAGSYLLTITVAG